VTVGDAEFGIIAHWQSSMCKVQTCCPASHLAPLAAAGAGGLSHTCPILNYPAAPCGVARAPSSATECIYMHGAQRMLACCTHEASALDRFSHIAHSHCKAKPQRLSHELNMHRQVHCPAFLLCSSARAAPQGAHRPAWRAACRCGAHSSRAYTHSSKAQSLTSTAEFMCYDRDGELPGAGL